MWKQDFDVGLTMSSKKAEMCCWNSVQFFSEIGTKVIQVKSILGHKHLLHLFNHIGQRSLGKCTEITCAWMLLMYVYVRACLPVKLDTYTPHPSCRLFSSSSELFPNSVLWNLSMPSFEAQWITQYPKSSGSLWSGKDFPLLHANRVAFVLMLAVGLCFCLVSYTTVKRE